MLVNFGSFPRGRSENKHLKPPPRFYNIMKIDKRSLSKPVMMYLPTGKLTYQWKTTIFNGKYIFKGSIFIAILVYWRVPTVTQGFRQPQKTQEVTPSKVSKIHTSKVHGSLVSHHTSLDVDIGAVFKNPKKTFRCTDGFLRDPSNGLLTIPT